MPEAGLAATNSGHSRGMGRGLAAILPRNARDETSLRELPLDLIRPNEDQPRRDFDGESLLALSESIKARGVLQPIVVRPLAGGTYELIAGERRWRASRMAHRETIPAIVREAEGAERLELALIENVAREDLNPVEEARACATLVEDLGVTKEELARRLGRSRPRLSNLIRILKLPDPVLELIEARQLSEAHGRALLDVADHDARRSIAEQAVRHGWSVRQLQAHIEGLGRERRSSSGGGSQAMPADLEEALARAEEAFTAALGREARIRPRGGRFRLELDFDEPAEAIELAERLRA